jgi:hypothetical protein
MNPWWNLPFAVLVLLALWCRLGSPGRLVGAIGAVLGFFGAGARQPSVAAADLFGIAGVSGLVFVGWMDELAVPADTWLLVDAVLTSIGLGLAGAWLLARFGHDPDDGVPVVERDRDRAAAAEAGRNSREVTMMEVDELPRRSPLGGGGGGSVGGAGAGGGSAPDRR